jgi:hypothetical protein
MDAALLVIDVQQSLVDEGIWDAHRAIARLNQLIFTQVLVAGDTPAQTREVLANLQAACTGIRRRGWWRGKSQGDREARFPQRQPFTARRNKAAHSAPRAYRCPTRRLPGIDT